MDSRARPGTLFNPIGLKTIGYHWSSRIMSDYHIIDCDEMVAHEPYNMQRLRVGRANRSMGFCPCLATEPI
jgi:hypothetical protein